MFSEQIISRERRHFGRQCLFSDRNELMFSVHPSGRLRTKYILRNPVESRTQLGPCMALSVMETLNVSCESHGLYHYEGGWPKELNILDEEQTLRYRKKVEREDSWGTQVGELIRAARHLAEQNNTLNIYEQYFEDVPEQVGRDIKLPMMAQCISVLRDLWLPPRCALFCEWQPGRERRLLTMFTRALQKDSARVSEHAGQGSSHAIYIWDLANTLQPELYFDMPEAVSAVKLCPKDEFNLAGGTCQPLGFVYVWDARASCSRPLRSCPLEAAHREPVASVCWVHSKANTEFYTGSLDGSIKYWDMRSLGSHAHELLLEPDTGDVQQRQDAHGVTVLEFEYTIPVRFIMGSDMGYVFVGNRKGGTPAETIVSHFQLFVGPIRRIMRNPFFVKNFLIVADWRAKIWSEECKSYPSTLYMRKRHQLMSGAWSTARCSLFVTGDARGTLDFWDLLLHQRAPVLSVQFKHPITNVIFRPDGRLLCVSLANGEVQLLRVRDSMCTATGRERALIAAMFEREISRCKLLEARVEELKLKRRTTAVTAYNSFAELPSQLNLDGDNVEQYLFLIESDEEFRQAMNDFHATVLATNVRRSQRKLAMEETVFEQLAKEEEQATP